MGDDVPDLVSSAASSTSSHGGLPVTPADVRSTRRPNKLRKQRAGSSPFSFIPDEPPAFSHFPFTFSAPSSPTSTLRYASTVTSATPLVRQSEGPKRTTSMPSRKLTKKQPAATTSDGGLTRRSTLSFSFRRRKQVHSLPSPPLPAAAPPPVSMRLYTRSCSRSHTLCLSFHRVKPSLHSAAVNQMMMRTQRKTTICTNPFPKLNPLPQPFAPSLQYPRHAHRLFVGRRLWPTLISVADTAESSTSASSSVVVDGHS